MTFLYSISQYTDQEKIIYACNIFNILPGPIASINGKYLFLRSGSSPGDSVLDLANVSKVIFSAYPLHQSLYEETDLPYSFTLFLCHVRAVNPHQSLKTCIFGVSVANILLQKMLIRWSSASSGFLILSLWWSQNSGEKNFRRVCNVSKKIRGWRPD